MLGKRRKKKPARRLWLTLLQGVLLLSLIVALVVPAGAGGPVPRLENLEAVQQARVTPDDQLDQLRGRLDNFLFGFKAVVDFDAQSGVIDGSVEFQTNVPLEEVNIGPTQVSFNNGQVSYHAGIGNTGVGPGVYSIAQVVGENIIFISNMDVTVNVLNMTPFSVTGLSSTPTVSAITR